MSTEAVTINGATVIRRTEYPWRWLDAFGEGVSKYVTSFESLPADDQTTDPTEFLNTIVEIGAGVSTAVLSDVSGGALVITTAAGENDGYGMQLGGAAGEWVDFSAAYPAYFGIKFQVNDATDTDVFFGLAPTDTDLAGGVTDGIFFRSTDASASLFFVVEKDDAESVTTVGTLADGVDVIAEWYYDGSTVTSYINSRETSSLAATDVHFPDNELLRLSLEFLTGEDVANTCTIQWVRMIQIQS